MVGRFDWLIDWIEACAYSARNDHTRAIARYQRLLNVNGPSAHVLVKIALSYNAIGRCSVRCWNIKTTFIILAQIINFGLIFLSYSIISGAYKKACSTFEEAYSVQRNFYGNAGTLINSHILTYPN